MIGGNKVVVNKINKEGIRRKDKENSIPFSVERTRYKASQITIKIKRLEIKIYNFHNFVLIKGIFVGHITLKLAVRHLIKFQIQLY